MTIKIKKITVTKDGAVPEIIGSRIIPVYKKLEGKINVEIREGNIKGDSKVEVNSISEGLQNELYTVLSKIEDELNGVSIDESIEDESKLMINFMYLAMKELGFTLEEVKKGKLNNNRAEEFSKKMIEILKSEKGCF